MKNINQKNYPNLDQAVAFLGSDPEFTDEVKYRTDEGEFTLHLTVKGEIVTDCTVYTDSLEPTAADRIRAEVVGKRFEEMQNAKGKMQN